jgi:hypothetical protein
MIVLCRNGDKLRHHIRDTASMLGCLTERLRSVAATSILTILLAAATVPPATSEPLRRPLADALPPARPSCHARVLDAAELAAHPGSRVTAIALERVARDLAAERKWGAQEEFDGTAIVSATLRVRLRGDPLAHSARLACARGDDGALECRNPACVGGEIRITGEGRGQIAISIGGTLKGGRFIGHYIHLDASCENRAGGPIVLESGDGDRLFSLPPAPQEACR